MGRAGLTTLDLIMGLGRPDKGAIEVLGLNQPHDEAAIKAKVAYVSPDLDYSLWRQVGRALDFVSGFYPDWDEARCERLLATFRLSRTDRIASLSFGARIKLSLVMALSRDAELLLLDEPTVGLDVQSRLTLFAEILTVMQREGATVVISSHHLAELERVADHVVILDRGRLLAAGRMDELVDRYDRLDASLTTGGIMPVLDGIKVIDRAGDRLRLLLDRRVADRASLAPAGIDVLAQTPMTLEELFVALVET